MAILTDTFGGIDFVSATGKVKTRATIKSSDSRSYGNFSPKFKSDRISVIDDNRAIGKVLPRSNLKTPLDNRSYGKVLPRNNIASLIDRRSVNRTETSTSTGSTLYSRYPSGIPSLGGITYPLPSATGYDLADIPKFDYNYRLEQFDNILDGSIFAVTGQDNVTYNSIQQYTYDLDILSVTISSTGAEQTIYFEPTAFAVLIPAGFYAKITSTAGVSWTVFVKSSTYQSITFDAVVGFPTSYTGALTLQSATSFVYPKSKVDSDLQSYLSINGLDLRNYSSTPRDLLSAAEITPNFRSYTTLFIDRDIQGITYQPTTDRLETFSDSNLIGEFQTVITGETTGVSYSTALWYINDSDTIGYSTSTLSVRVLSFPETGAAPFLTGSTVRIRNTQTGSILTTTVIEGGSTYIKVATTASTPAPAIGSIIERTVNTVYAQSFVNTQVAPTTPREMLYYSAIAPGLLGTEYTPWGYSLSSADSILTTGKTLSSAKLKDTNLIFAASYLNKQLLAIRADNSNVAIGKLRSAQVIKNSLDVSNLARVETYYSQTSTSVWTTTRPVTAGERFYYFNLAPGYRYNRTLEQGSTVATDYATLAANTLNKPVSALISDKITLSVDKLSSATKLLPTARSDINRISFVNNAKFNTSTVQIFFTPTFDSLKGGLVVKAETTKINLSVLYDGFVVKADASDVSKSNYIDILKIKSKDTKIFDSPVSNTLEKSLARLTDGDILLPQGVLEKPVSIVKGDKTILSVYKANSIAKIVADLSSIVTSRVENPLQRLSTDRNLIQSGLVDKFTVPSITTELFDTPSSNFLYQGFVVKDINLRINFDKLNNGFVARSDSISIQTGAFERLKTPSDSTQVFFTPAALKLSPDWRLKPGTETPSVSKLSASAVLRADGISYPIGKLSAAVKVIADKIVISPTSRIELWEDQSTYSSVYLPNSPKARLQFFKLAPGFRYNLSIEQGKVFEPDRAIISTDNLNELIESKYVTTNVAPTTPREMLYYANIAGGYKYGQLNTVWGSSLSDESPYNIKISSLERDQWRIRAVRETLNSGNLEKQLMVLRTISNPIEITFLNPLKLKDYKNQVFFVANNGLILKLKTGNSAKGERGIFDPAAPKKEPIQFWN